MRRALAGALAIAGVLAPPQAVLAHRGNPNMQSIVRAIEPPTPGVSIQVLNRDDRFELTNRSGRTVLIYGYGGDPYARILGDGTVEVNTRSPASYLNDDRFGAAPVPASASATAPPKWSVLDKTGRFQWHDHRMHYMGTGVPPQVKNRDKRQKVFDYSIPIRIGTRKGDIAGTLYWTPEPGGGPPTFAIVLLAAIALGGAAAVVVVRRRRSRETGPEAGRGPPEPAEEAW
ncbi:MAG: hypothetical protein U0R70_12710 [Solirubrobacteraceae bacterium]